MAQNTQILQEASAWFVDFREGDVDTARRQAFNEWLRTSPEHIQAYLDVSAFWEDVSQMASPEDIDMVRLLAAARDRGNVSRLDAAVKPASPQASRPETPRLRRKTALAASIALISVSAAGLGVWAYTTHNPTHHTAVGEQKSLTLLDGSMVQLNSRSSIRVHFDEAERGIELLDGQALFDVAQEAGRPFVVYSGETRVRAIGTQFDVYRKPEGTTITVIEGRVAIDDGMEPLSAGEQVMVNGTAVFRSSEPNIAAATAWTQRRLIFQSASLAEVVNEFNRYNERQLIVEGPGFDNVHVSAVFSSTDPASLIRFLRERFDVHIHETGSEVHIHH